MDEQIEKRERVLVVDDEASICEIIHYNLKRFGYDVEMVHSAEEALAVLRTKQYDLILLDIMMGGMSGIDLAQVLRQDYKNNTPIIFLSALDTEPDILKGFRSGGDDYIAKPFSINQVVARVGAVIKRYKIAKEQPSVSESVKVATHSEAIIDENEDKYSFSKLMVDVAQKEVFVDDKEISLTKTEFNILALLAQYFGKTVSRENILKNVWSGNILVTERTVDVHIARLRKKIEMSGVKIFNKSGYGYSLDYSKED